MDITGRQTRLKGRIAHLLSWPRRKRKTATPRWRDVDSYASLVCASQPSMLWLYEPQPLLPNTELLFPELATREIRELHPGTQPRPGRIGIAAMPKAVVSGQSLVGTSALLYLMAPITPLYIDQGLADQGLAGGGAVGNRKLSRKAKRRVRGVSILLTTWTSGTYGHWLLEGMPKLLLLRRIAHELSPLRIVLSTSLPSWIAEWTRLVLPQATFEIYDDAVEYLQCDLLLMPTQLANAEHFPHPVLATLIDELLATIPPATHAPARVFVKRSSPNIFRELTNYHDIEQIAVEEGLALIEPEKLSIPQQIAQFGAADLIVGEFGSAMHNTLFSPSGSRVFCLNWINVLQSFIGQLKRQHVGYLLPASGPVTYRAGMPRVEYRIDPDVFRNYLRKLMVE